MNIFLQIFDIDRRYSKNIFDDGPSDINGTAAI